LAEIFNKVIAQKPEAKLVLIGGDSSDIKTGNVSTFKLMQDIFSEEAKKQVNYLGRVPYEKVQEYIKKSHVCTYPSFAETLGMVTIESMAMQKPVVNTSIGWAQELIDDGINGYLVHPSDINSYANRILMLFSDNTLCKEIGKNARRKVEEAFDIEKNVEINIDFYNTLINS
jgi:glycosyltransferase involved in cell wall biosynthesis